MLSAFGVDHGEISKGVRLKLIRTPSRAAAKKMTMGPKGSKTGPQKIKSGAKKVTDASISVSGIGRGVGQAGEKTGSFLERHPGITGTAIVGGAGAGGYHLLRQKEPKRRSS